MSKQIRNNSDMIQAVKDAKVAIKRLGEQKHELPKTIALTDLTAESLDILEHFGLDAPHLLNQYAITMEDALIEQVRFVLALRKQNNQLQLKIADLQDQLLSDPELLCD